MDKCQICGLPVEQCEYCQDRKRNCACLTCGSPLTNGVCEHCLRRDRLSRCRVCGLPLVGKLCGHCLEAKAQHEEYYQNLIQKFQLKRGCPTQPAEKTSL